MGESSAGASRVVPRPRTRIPLLGPAFAIARDTLGTLERWDRDAGDVYRVDVPGRKTWVVNRPAEIEKILTHHGEYFIKDAIVRRARPLFGDGLILSEHDLWKRQRRMMQPAFLRKRVAAYAPRIIEMTERHIDTWTADEVRNVHADAATISLAIASDTFFGDGAVPSEVVGTSLHQVLKRFDGVWALLPDWLPFGPFAGSREGIRHLDQVVSDLVARRRQGQHEGRQDLLSTLLAAQDEDGSVMNDKQLRDEMLSLLLAGHETVANTLCWTWHLLSRHPEAEARMLAEVDALGDLRTADHSSLKFTIAVMQEAMRLYPPIWLLSREVIKAWEVDGFAVEPGVQVSMAAWVVHRNPVFFPDPLAFKPERWLDASTEKNPDYSYFPFGGGQRLCIGRPFGELEGTLVLASVARRYRLRAVPNHPIVPVPSLTLRPRGGLPMTIERRAGA